MTYHIEEIRKRHAEDSKRGPSRMSAMLIHADRAALLAELDRLRRRPWRTGEAPACIYWCHACRGGVGVFPLSVSPPIRCPDPNCHASDFAPLRYVPEGLS